MEYFLIAIVVLAVLCVVYYISTYNKFVSLENKIEEAFSTMDVYLVKRAELVPNLVNTVKGYAKHESETLEKVIASRSSAKTADERIKAEEGITSAIRNLLSLTESYPELRADSSFVVLQRQLADIEGDIQNSRKYYNGTVRAYNTMLQTFPSSFVASYKGFVKQPLFEVSDDSQRQNVKVEF